MKTLLRSDELNCPSCIPKIEKALGRFDGVTDATVHFASGRIEVEHDTDKVSVDDLVAAVAKVGYTARAAAF